MKNFFTYIYSMLKSRPRTRNGLLLLLVVVFGWGAWQVEMQEDISSFLPSTSQTKQIRYVASHLDGQDKIIVNLRVEGSFDDAQSKKDYSVLAAERFVAVVDSTMGDYVDSIFYHIDEQQTMGVATFVSQNLPYFIEEADYRRLDSLIVNGLVDQAIANDKATLSTFIGSAMEPILRCDPLSIGGGALQKLAKMNVNGQYALYDGYLFDKEFEDQIVILTPRWGSNNTAQNEGLGTALQNAVDQTVKEFENIEISYFGAPLISVQNANQIKQDSLLSIILSVVLILGLMYYALRSFKTMILVTLPVVFGGLFALCAIWLIQGSISAIAIGAGSIIFGISISYSIHYVWYASHCVSNKMVIEDIAQPMIVGSLSTVGAFLSLLFINAASMRDFGLFAALSLVGSIVFVLIFLPHLNRTKVQRKPMVAFGKISKYRIEGNRYVLVVALVMTVVLWFFASKTTFSTDMQKINFMTDRQRADMKAILEPDTTLTTLCVASVNVTMDGALDGYYEVLPVVEKLVEERKVVKVNGFGDFLPSTSVQQQKIERWNQFWATHNKDSLIASVQKAALENGFSSLAFVPFFEALNRNYKVENEQFFENLPFVKPYLIVNEQGQNAVLIYAVVEKAMVDAVLSQIDQKGSVVAFDQGSFNASMVEMLASDFNFVLYVCSIIVFVLLLVSFWRIEITLVAFLPMVVSWVWILGIMGLLGIDFNIINIILATFIFGLGDDFSIFITDGLMHEYAYRSRITDSHKSAVVLSSLTMLFGIGTLVFARHPAMLSLGYVTIIGMFCVVVAAYLLPPLLFRYLVYKNGKPRLAPITAQNFAASIYSFFGFLVGSLVLSVSGFVLLTVMRRSDRNKLLFHKVLCGVSRFVIRNMPMVDHRIENLNDKTFSKGRVIVANHQSHIDLMYILALDPKIIIATNEWVWKSPFYGLIIRYADFFPVAQGVGQSVEVMRPMIEKGYSIVVFPEGTRSEDMAVHRFHKGAFYLAQQLGVEVLPVVLHGVGAALPKQEFLLRHGKVTLSIMEPIKFGDDSLNLHAKSTRAAIAQQLAKVRDEVENCNYFYRLVIYNYIYKGIEVESRARKLLKQNDNYNRFVDLLPKSGVVVVENCDIGVATLMAALVRRNLTIYATCDDAKKLTLASNCGAVPQNLKYVDDVSKVDWDMKVDLNDLTVEYKVE